MTPILICLFFVIAVIGLLWYKCKNVKESFSGALTQLMAKGPQDRHLIGSDAYKYYYLHPYYYPYPYYETVWNNPTRFRGAYYYYPHFTSSYPIYYNPYREYVYPTYI